MAVEGKEMTWDESAAMILESRTKIQEKLDNLAK